jgi:hypothetical protein
VGGLSVSEGDWVELRQLMMLGGTLRLWNAWGHSASFDYTSDCGLHSFTLACWLV